MSYNINNDKPTYNDYMEYSAMHEQFMQLPLIQGLKKEIARLSKINKKLVNRNDALVELVLTLNDKKCMCNDNKCNKKMRKPLRQVKIKEEPVVEKKVEMPSEENSRENDVVEVEASKKQNIVYEIVEDSRVDVVKEEEAAEEEVVEEEEEEEEEEAAEEEEVVEEEEEEVVEEGEEEAAEEEAEEEEGEEVYEVTIKGKTYYTTNESNGTIYSIDVNGELDSEVGKFVNGAPVFNK
jgi:hypothetical protein